MTDEDKEIIARYAARLEASNPKPAEPVPSVAYTCLRCGGRFERPVGKAPPKQCPVCQCYGWNDPGRNFRRRGHGNPGAAG